MKMQEKIIAVTGAGSGIGSELALLLLQKGAKVAAIDLRTEGLEALKQKAGQQADGLSLHTADISDKDAIARLAEEIIKHHSAIDGLINCAGIIQPFVKINDLDHKDIERVMNVNFYGTVFMTKAFLPHLLERPEAHIVNFSSMGGFLPVPGQGVYGASKAAVKLFTEALYAELLDTPVKVSVVFPGATATNISQNSGVQAPGASSNNADIQKMALPPKEVAQQIVWGIEKNKVQIFTGKDSKMMNRLYRLNPVYATKLIASKMSSLLQ